MDHADWIGISVLVSTVTSCVISLIAAIQGMRNHQAIKDVERTVNGSQARMISEAHQSGVLEAQVAHLKESRAPVPPGQ